MRILAAIVLYSPDTDRLIDNINAILPQVDGIAFFNNGEKTSDIFELPGVVLDSENNNVGIAIALNRLCQFAIDNNYDWILTLDQDSICPEGLVLEYKKYLDNPTIGMICPRILDRNYGSLHYDGQEGAGIEIIDACITSASLLRLSAWQQVGGFWEDLFIDMVDFDMCWSLQEKGFIILRTNQKSLLHEIGHSKRVLFRGEENVIYNHPPIRSYYISRNTIAVGRKHHRLKQCFRWDIKRFILILLFENNRLIKCHLFLKGLIEGFRMKIK